MTEPQRSNPATIRPDALRMHHEQNPFDRRHAGAVIVGNAVWCARCGSGRSMRPQGTTPRQFETTHPSRRVFLLVDLKKRWFYNKHLLSTGVL